MKIKKALLIFCIFLLSSCSNPSSKENREFKSFVSSLKQLETPISFDSNKDYQIPLSYPKENAFFLKLQEKLPGFGVFGKVFETKSFIAVLGNIPTDSGDPVIITFNKNGDKIEIYSLYQTVMGDMGRYTWNYALIKPNMQIVFIDSTVTRKINADGTDEIPGTDSLTVTNKLFQINKEGRFQEKIK